MFKHYNSIGEPTTLYLLISVSFTFIKIVSQVICDAVSLNRDHPSHAFKRPIDQSTQFPALTLVSIVMYVISFVAYACFVGNHGGHVVYTVIKMQLLVRYKQAYATYMRRKWN